MNDYRILVVEDDDASRDALRRLFVHKGWLVSVAKTISEGLEALDPPPHCVILDLMLPDGEGEDLLRKLREDNLPSRVAVCTGTNDPVRIALVKGLDPDALFQKPIDFEELCRVLEAKTEILPGRTSEAKG